MKNCLNNKLQDYWLDLDSFVNKFRKLITNNKVKMANGITSAF